MIKAHWFHFLAACHVTCTTLSAHAIQTYHPCNPVDEVCGEMPEVAEDAEGALTCSIEVDHRGGWVLPKFQSHYKVCRLKENGNMYSIEKVATCFEQAEYSPNQLSCDNYCKQGFGTAITVEICK